MGKISYLAIFKKKSKYTHIEAAYDEILAIQWRRIGIEIEFIFGFRFLYHANDHTEYEKE